MKDWARGYARCYLVGDKPDVTRLAAGEARRRKVFAGVDEEGAKMVKVPRVRNRAGYWKAYRARKREAVAV